MIKGAISDVMTLAGPEPVADGVLLFIGLEIDDIVSAQTVLF